MSLRVLLVPDKFKGSLSAPQAAAAIAEGWRQVRPADVLDVQPMADGGDGFGAVFGALLGATACEAGTVDCTGAPRPACWWHAPAQGVALIEAAEVNGLARLPAGRHHPFAMDTRGLGVLVRAALAAGATRLYLGLGGSATNDGGFGLAQALGWRFLDTGGGVIDHWPGLERLARIEPPTQPLPPCEWVAVVDVDNPLLGARGATAVYGPQKGLRGAELAQAERALQRLATVMDAHHGRALSQQPGAGAAGGLGFGLSAFCGARLQSGAALFQALAGLDARLAAADLVLTAEGSLDAQSLMGKGVGAIAMAAAAAGKPCWCLAAVSDQPDTLPGWPCFRHFSIVPALADRAQSMADAAPYLRQLAAMAAASAGALSSR